MPIYEYNCAKCGKTFEIIQKLSDAPLKTHAGCGGKVTKLISAAGFQFKGTGWYVTDYARKDKGGSKDAKSDSGKSSESAGASSSSKSNGSDKTPGGDAAPSKGGSKTPSKSGDS